MKNPKTLKMPYVEKINFRNYFYVAAIEDPEDVLRLIFDEHAYANREELELRIYRDYTNNFQGFGEGFIEQFLEVSEKEEGP